MNEDDVELVAVDGAATIAENVLTTYL